MGRRDAAKLQDWALEIFSISLYFLENSFLEGSCYARVLFPGDHCAVRKLNTPEQRERDHGKEHFGARHLSVAF